MNRHTADQHLINMGYQHPEKPCNIVDEYKKYTGNNDSVYKTSKNHGGYKTEGNAYNEDTDKNDKTTNFKINKNKCPVCNEQAMFKCSCDEFGDMLCKNKHYWWVDNNNVFHIEDPHL